MKNLIGKYGVEKFLDTTQALTELVIESGKDLQKVIDALPDDDPRKVMYLNIVSCMGVPDVLKPVL